MHTLLMANNKLFLSLSSHVKLTHPSNELPQDNIIMFQDPLVLMGLKMNNKRHILVLNCETRRREKERRNIIRV